MDGKDWAGWIQAIAGLLQAGVSAYAMSIAFQAHKAANAAAASGAAAAAAANRDNKQSFFRERAATEMFDLLRDARKIRKIYESLFRKFASVPEKKLVQNEFTTTREDLAVRIEELCEMAPELAPLVEAWSRVHEEEAHHAVSNSLEASPAEEKEAMRRYSKVHDAFVHALGDSLQALRT